MMMNKRKENGKEETEEKEKGKEEGIEGRGRGGEGCLSRFPFLSSSSSSSSFSFSFSSSFFLNSFVLEEAEDDALDQSWPGDAVNNSTNIQPTERRRTK